MPRCLISLGSNLGDRGEILQKAVTRLTAVSDVTDVAVSRWFETAPVGGPAGQGAFLNGAVALTASLSPEALWGALRQIESELGRLRGERWAARSVDLDLLLYGDLCFDSPHLTIPHPRMAFRRFVLEPAAEIAPRMVHPQIRWTVAQLLAHLNRARPYIALISLPGGGKTALAEAVAGEFQGRVLHDPLGNSALTRSADPPSPDLPRQLQFLDRAASLAADLAAIPPDELVVSDYYFDQCLAYARADLSDDDFQLFRQAWERRAAQVPKPKLLVVLDSPSSRGAPSAECVSVPTAGYQSGSAGGLRQALFDVASRPGQGPVLWAESTDRQAALDEVCAAVLAMR